MSAASPLHVLLEHLLPTHVMPLAKRPSALRARASQRDLAHDRAVLGEHASLIDRLGHAHDIQTVYRGLRSQAITGDSAVLNALGWAWLQGNHWQVDVRLATQLLRMAALQGNAAACFNLGQQQYFGKGVPVSYTAAAACYRRAYEYGSAHAAAALGDLYEEEVCDDSHEWHVDPAEAYRWFQRGAQRGETRCRFEVGYRLLHGVQVEVDVGAAVYWLELAASERVVQAAEALATYYRDRADERYGEWRDRALVLGSRLGEIAVRRCGG